MHKMYEDLHAKGLEIVSITGFYGFYGLEKNLGKDAEFARMDSFRKEYGMSWPLVFDDLTNFRTLGISAIPTTILIGRDGKVRSVETGYTATGFAALREEIEKELKH